MHAGAVVCLYLISETTLLFCFMSLALSFKIQILACYIIAYFVSFDSPFWSLKSDIIRGSYELSDVSGRSCMSLAFLWLNFTFSIMSLALSFKIPILLGHIIMYFVTFDLPIWTLKSDITRGSNELSESLGCSCLSMPDFYDNFKFSFMSLALNFEI